MNAARITPRTGKRRLMFVLLLFISQAATAEVTSIADWSCLEWSERRASGTRLAAPQMWLSGYLTGLASAYAVDALAITDADSTFVWMDKYCAAYPQENISTGALILFRDLAGKLPSGPALSL